MTASTRFGLAAAFALAAFPAFADLTAADVWDDWKAQSADLDQTLSVGSEEAAGGVLTLRDVTITMDTPEGGVNSTIEEIVLRPRGDGSVQIEMSDEFPLDVTMAPEGEDPVRFTILIDQSALDLVASGAPGAISYSYAAPQMSVTLADARTGDTPLDFEMALTIAGLAGAYTVTEGDLRTVDSDLAADTVTMNISGTDPEGSGDTFEMTVAMADLVSDSTGTFGTFMRMATLPELVEDGGSAQGTTSHGALTFLVSATSEGTPVTMAGGTAAGSYEISIGPDGLVYGGVNRDVTLSVSGGGMPFPEVAVGMQETGGQLTMPVTVSEDPKDAGLALRLVGITVNESIWSMFDPAGVLPRDPATLVIDIAAQANWLVDVFDPAFDETDLQGMPGEVQSVEINALQLSAVGAALSGSGAFTFDNSGPVPNPAGTVNLELVGGNALLDRLVQMGLLPEDQAMGARMMLGLFARPGQGADTLVSEITLQPDGAVLANGQRIR